MGATMIGYDIYPAAIDTTTSSGVSWVKSSSAGLEWDLIDNHGYPGNWLVRANSAASVPEPGTLVLLGLGLLGLKMSRKHKKS